MGILEAQETPEEIAMQIRSEQSSATATSLLKERRFDDFKEFHASWISRFKAEGFQEALILEELDLSNQDLVGVNFDHVNFFNSDFSGVDMTQVSCISTQFCRVSLKGANLTEVDLSGGRLQFVDFSQANLTNAILDTSTVFPPGTANLTDALLVGTSMKRAAGKFIGISSDQLRSMGVIVHS